MVIEGMYKVRGVYIDIKFVVDNIKTSKSHEEEFRGWTYWLDHYDVETYVHSKRRDTYIVPSRKLKEAIDKINIEPAIWDRLDEHNKASEQDYADYLADVKRDEGLGL